MKIRLTFTAIAVGLLLASNIAMADKDKGKGKHRTEISDNRKWPEISITSGTSAIALLAGALLLVGERSRSRRS
jgi:hypothetical protein